MRLTKNALTNAFIIAVCGLMITISCSKDDPGTSEENSENSSENTPDIPVDNSARSAAKLFYQDYYLTSRSNGQETAWAGNTSSCNAGGVDQEIRDKIFMRLAYYRLASGLNNTVSENSDKSDKAQQAALMMKANSQLEHNPPNSWKCYTEDGKDGAGNSLLTMSKNAEAIDSYIRDQGANNGPVGHRRWLLWPRLQEIGIGNTDSSNAIWVLGNAGTVPSDAPEFVAWPPEGYIPAQLAFPRWSFSIKDADFSTSTISMKDDNGTTVPLTIETLSNQFGDRTIVWVPEGIQKNATEDKAYTVTIKDVDISGELKEYEYIVILFDPDN